MKIAVTGGIASGKTSVVQLFKKFGAHIVSADTVVHQLLSPETKIGKKVIALLGAEVVTDNQINHDSIAHIVFNNAKLLHNLEKILHPAVNEEIEREYQQVKRNKGAKLFVAEIPLLFEIGAEESFDLTIAVDADDLICCERFKQKNSKGHDEYHRRMLHQLLPKEKSQRADIVISNNGSLAQLEQSTKDIFNQLIKE